MSKDIKDGKSAIRRALEDAVDWVSEKITGSGMVGNAKDNLKNRQKQLEEQEREAMGEPKKKAKK